MPDEFMATFENAWITLRSQWCDQHDLRGALAFSHDRAKIDFFHRVVQVNVDEARVDGLIQDALHLFQDKQFDCAFTLSPLDRPADLARRLQDRGFKSGKRASAMIFQPVGPRSPEPSAVEVEVSDESEYETWADVMCNSFGLPAAVKEVGRSVLITPQAHRYLARVDGVPVGTTLLYSGFGMGYLDFVGTLPAHRGQGIASALVTRATADSQSLGNRWTALETVTGSDAERLYAKLGFRPTFHRQRYTMPFTPATTFARS